jgi:hypothetical protein
VYPVVQLLRFGPSGVFQAHLAPQIKSWTLRPISNTKLHLDNLSRLLVVHPLHITHSVMAHRVRPILPLFKLRSANVILKAIHVSNNGFVLTQRSPCLSSPAFGRTEHRCGSTSGPQQSTGRAAPAWGAFPAAAVAEPSVAITMSQ